MKTPTIKMRLYLWVVSWMQKPFEYMSKCFTHPVTFKPQPQGGLSYSMALE